MHTLITLGSRGIESWCRPFPLSFHGKIEQFDFHVRTAEFTLQIRVPALRDDPLWVNEGEEAVKNALETPAWAELYLPYVHYAPERAVPGQTEGVGKGRLVGEPEVELVLPASKGKSGEAGVDGSQDGQGAGAEWKSGQGAGGARVDLEILEMSEGTLQVQGQKGRWLYYLKEKESRTIKLKIRPWKGQ